MGLWSWDLALCGNQASKTQDPRSKTKDPSSTTRLQFTLPISFLILGVNKARMAIEMSKPIAMPP